MITSAIKHAIIFLIGFLVAIYYYPKTIPFCTDHVPPNKVVICKVVGDP